MAKKNPTDKKPIDLNDVEMVFGSPVAPKREPNPDVHLIANEKNNGKEVPKAVKASSHDHEADAVQPTQPLLEPDRARQKPPLAGQEIDDLDGDAPATAAYPGIDDGLLEDKKPEGHTGDESPENPENKENGDSPPLHDDGVNTDDGKWHEFSHGVDETDFYYGDGYMGNGIHNRFGEDRPGSPMVPGVSFMSIPDVNTYQQKKNLAQGMMDLALLSANANQLRYVLESSITHPYYYPSLVFITCSIILQIAVGVGLIMNSRYNVKDEKDICKADKINNMTVLGIFLITIVNVFITSFSVATPTATNALVVGQNAG